MRDDVMQGLGSLEVPYCITGVAGLEGITSPRVRS